MAWKIIYRVPANKNSANSVKQTNTADRKNEPVKQTQQKNISPTVGENNNKCKRTPHEQAIFNKKCYPNKSDLQRLSVKKAGTNTNAVLLKESAEAFERANKRYREKTGRNMQVNSAYRSPEEQQKLYDKLKGKQAVAKPGKSLHNYGLGLDVQDYKEAKKFLEAEGFKWRNHYKDPWHFDYVGSK